MDEHVVKAGVLLLFLPPYSPDLGPIELLFPSQVNNVRVVNFATFLKLQYLKASEVTTTY